MPASVIILAPLCEPLGRSARCPAAVHAFEFIEALASDAMMRQRIRIDVAAARGSKISLPLISLEPRELDWPGPDWAASQWLEAFLWQEFHLSGALDCYDLVHSLTTLSAPLQDRVASGRASALFAATPVARVLAGAFRASNAPVTTVLLDEWASVDKGYYPVDLQHFALPLRCGKRVCLAPDADVPKSVKRRSGVVTVQSVQGITELNPRLVIGPAGEDRFVHFVWALRAFAIGAAYVYSGRVFDLGSWPRLALHRYDPKREASLNKILLAPPLPSAGREAIRRWVLGYCAPAATAAAVRRLYDETITLSRAKDNNNPIRRAHSRCAPQMLPETAPILNVARRPRG